MVTRIKNMLHNIPPATLTRLSEQAIVTVGIVAIMLLATYLRGLS